jgi:hypothetical protein
MKIKTASYSELRDKDAQGLISDLRSGKYSLLDSIGCHKLRSEMRFVGIACRTILRRAERKAGGRKKADKDFPQRLRQTMLKTLKRGAPYVFHGVMAHDECGIVIGFNHPTLGEIIRLIALCLEQYPDREYLFPVNIAWYEALAPIADRMEAFGLHIVPTITPPTRKKIAAITDADTMALVDKISKKFNANYISSCQWFAQRKGLIVVAPSATRQASVFKTKEMFIGAEAIDPPTMTYLAITLDHNKSCDYRFQALAVSPPRKAKRGLNLLKKYDLYSSRVFDKEAVAKLCKEKDPGTHERCFEREFLKSICTTLNLNHREDISTPQ